MQEWTSSMASPEVPVNENFDALSWAAVYAKNAVDSSGLNWAYYGGQWSGFTVAADTITLSNAAINRLVVDRADGALISTTSDTNWNDVASYARVYRVTTAGGLVTAVADYRSGLYGVHGATDTAPIGAGALTQCIAIACSDETTALTTGTAKVTFRMPFDFVLSEVRASLTTAQASGAIATVDINEDGITILSTKITIDNTEKSSKTALTQPVIGDSPSGLLLDDAEITIDIDQLGDGSAAGLKVYLVGEKP